MIRLLKQNQQKVKTGSKTDYNKTRILCPACGIRNHPGNVYCRDVACRTGLEKGEVILI